MTATILLIVMWLSGGGVRVESLVIPDGVDCGSVAVAYIGLKITGNPVYSDATWSCLDVPKTPEPAA